MKKLDIRKKINAALLTVLLTACLSMPVFADATYTVKSGDNLSMISAMCYAAASDWTKIYDSNRNIISNPNVIYAGIQLSIPDPITAEQFYGLEGNVAYDLVKRSNDSWVVTSYDLITPSNIKETAVVTVGEDGLLSFNLAWPPYGGYVVGTINSIGDLSGVVNVSRIGGNGGHSICFGNNADGSEYTASQRAIPSSSVSYRTGIMNIDLYKAAVNVVSSKDAAADKVAGLMALGFSDKASANMISEYSDFYKRSEMAGNYNIIDGIKITNRTVDTKYGFYGITAPWKSANLDLEGGAGQMTTVFSFGTLIDSGIIGNVK